MLTPDLIESSFRQAAVVIPAHDEAKNTDAHTLAHLDAAHAGRVADLSVYVRQSHAERDLEQLGHLAGSRL